MTQQITCDDSWQLALALDDAITTLHVGTISAASSQAVQQPLQCLSHVQAACRHVCLATVHFKADMQHHITSGAGTSGEYRTCEEIYDRGDSAC